MWVLWGIRFMWIVPSIYAILTTDNNLTEFVAGMTSFGSIVYCGPKKIQEVFNNLKVPTTKYVNLLYGFALAFVTGAIILYVVSIKIVDVNLLIRIILSVFFVDVLYSIFKSIFKFTSVIIYGVTAVMSLLLSSDKVVKGLTWKPYEEMNQNELIVFVLLTYAITVSVVCLSTYYSRIV